jgi:hypothetical protein
MLKSDGGADMAAGECFCSSGSPHDEGSRRLLSSSGTVLFYSPLLAVPLPFSSESGSEDRSLHPTYLLASSKVIRCNSYNRRR